MEFEPIRFPIIYFPFNVTTLHQAQVNKMHDILTLMRQHPDSHIPADRMVRQPGK
jgi:outer membrane protein OmpA-like peptidoglycan-associated protein